MIKIENPFFNFRCITITSVQSHSFFLFCFHQAFSSRFPLHCRMIIHFFQFSDFLLNCSLLLWLSLVCFYFLSFFKWVTWLLLLLSHSFFKDDSWCASLFEKVFFLFLTEVIDYLRKSSIVMLKRCHQFTLDI